jgi:hypothetical protein
VLTNGDWGEQASAPSDLGMNSLGRREGAAATEGTRRRQHAEDVPAPPGETYPSEDGRFSRMAEIAGTAVSSPARRTRWAIPGRHSMPDWTSAVTQCAARLLGPMTVIAPPGFALRAAQP